MGKFYLVAMQAETVGRLAVELVTDDGAAETVGVGAVHTQLVGTPRVGVEGE